MYYLGHNVCIILIYLVEIVLYYAMLCYAKLNGSMLCRN
jgi:hypothetical protein